MILSIETSSDNCSVALHRRERLIAINSINIQHTCSEFLVSMIKQLINYAKIDKKEIEAIAVSKGPGSYTGLRIGTSTAKGLCYAWKIPLIPICTLEAIALQGEMRSSPFINSPFFIIATINSIRKEIYTSTFDNQLQSIDKAKFTEVSTEIFSNILKTKKVIILVGTGVQKCLEFLKSSQIIAIHNIEASAIEIGYLAYYKHERKDYCNCIDFEPLYLKEFITTISKKRKYDFVKK